MLPNHMRQNLKSGLLVLLFICLGLTFLTQPALADVWDLQAKDSRKALPNDASKPARLIPKHQLTPIAPSEVGAIRRVNLTKPEPVVALTFDLCELATTTTGCDLGILGYLHKNHVPATLFMGGKWMRTHRERTKLLLQDPLFEIANHAWTHGNCTRLSPQGLKAQVLWTQAQYELLREEVAANLQDSAAAKNLQPIPKLFRPPYARCNRQNLELIAQLGLKVVLWDVVGETGPISNASQARNKAQALVKQVKPGSIILLHANLVPQGTALLVQELVPMLQAQGYKFLKVSDLLTLGTEVRVDDGYFSRPNDNARYDKDFGIDGTGLASPFTGQ